MDKKRNACLHKIVVSIFLQTACLTVCSLLALDQNLHCHTADTAPGKVFSLFTSCRKVWYTTSAL